jgi:hypothetical protein
MRAYLDIQVCQKAYFTTSDRSQVFPLCGFHKGIQVCKESFTEMEFSKAAFGERSSDAVNI